MRLLLFLDGKKQAEDVSKPKHRWKMCKRNGVSCGWKLANCTKKQQKFMVLASLHNGKEGEIWKNLEKFSKIPCFISIFWII